MKLFGRWGLPYSSRASKIYTLLFHPLSRSCLIPLFLSNFGSHLFSSRLFYFCGWFFTTETSHGRFFRGKVGQDPEDAACAALRPRQTIICFFNARLRYKSGRIFPLHTVFLIRYFSLSRMLSGGGRTNRSHGDPYLFSHAGPCGNGRMHAYSRVQRLLYPPLCPIFML